MTPRHIIVIGAARSGTKLVRDVLATATGAGRVPYDIGYVWRVGNEGCPDDALPPGSMGDRQRRFVRHYVDRHAAGDPPAVIEKTVGNTLRLPFVTQVFPDARYVHVVRDGVDVIESAVRQWTAPTDLRYLLGKARTFPLRLAPRYGLKYLRSVARRRGRSDGRLGSWGPRYPGIDADLRETSLLTVCARQWRASVTRARQDIQHLGVPSVELRYEQLLVDPHGELVRVADSVGLRASPSGSSTAASAIVTGRQGAGRAVLTAQQLAELEEEVGDILDELGYDRPITTGSRGSGHEQRR